MDVVHLHWLQIRYHLGWVSSIFTAKLYDHLCSEVYFDDSDSDHLDILCILDLGNCLVFLDINLSIFHYLLGLLSIFLLFDIMMILSLVQLSYFAIAKTNWFEYVQLVANSPAISKLLDMANLSNNATFEYEKLNSYLKLCMDKLGLPWHFLMVGLVVASTYFHRTPTVVAVAATAVQPLYPKFAIYDWHVIWNKLLQISLDLAVELVAIHEKWCQDA